MKSHQKKSATHITNLPTKALEEIIKNLTPKENILLGQTCLFFQDQTNSKSYWKKICIEADIPVSENDKHYNYEYYKASYNGLVTNKNEYVKTDPSIHYYIVGLYLESSGVILPADSRPKVFRRYEEAQKNIQCLQRIPKIELTPDIIEVSFEKSKYFNKTTTFYFFEKDEGEKLESICIDITKPEQTGEITVYAVNGKEITCSKSNFLKKLNNV